MRPLTLAALVVSFLASSTLGDEPKKVNYGEESAGGNGGREFSGPLLPDDAIITAIQVNSGRNLDGIKISYRTADGKSHTVQYGAVGGDLQKAVTSDAGVHLIGISGRAADRVDAIRFHFSDGTMSELFGGNGGKEFKLMVPEKNGRYVGHIVGFKGKFGRVIDNISIVYTVD